MSSSPASPSYLDVLRTPHAARTFGAALLGRLSYGIVFLSLVLAATRATGSYADAGVLLALFGLASSALSPLRARVIDRVGPRRALPPMSAAYVLFLAVFAAASWRPGVPIMVLWVVGALAGACTPPLGPVTRALWSGLLPDRDLRQRAFSMDTVAEELLYVIGPLLAGLCAALANPALGVVVSAALVAIGVPLLVTSPAVPPGPAGDGPGQTADAAAESGPGAATESGPGAATEGAAIEGAAAEGIAAGRGAPGRSRVCAGLVRSMSVAGGVGLCLGALSLLTVAFATRERHPAAVAWVEAALAVGSVVGGLAYGARTWRVPAAVRLPVLAAALGLSLGLAGFSANLWVLVVAVGWVGLFVSPVLTTAYLIADETAAPQARTQAGAWVNTAFNLANSAGTAGVGLVLDRLPLAACFVIAAVPAVLSAVATLVRVGRAERFAAPVNIPGRAAASTQRRAEARATACE